jgi:hypothetical protein
VKLEGLFGFSLSFIITYLTTVLHSPEEAKEWEEEEGSKKQKR